MASFRGHLAFSASLGGALGGLAWWQLGFDPGTAVLAAGVTMIGGMLPDLDSDSGVPIREMFNLAGVIVPLLFLRRLVHAGLQVEEILVILGGMYLAIRYGARRLFKRLTVHRGMFHSIPAMFIAGLITFLGYGHPNLAPRLLLSAAVMVGFFSHLLLDELCTVDLRGLKPRLNHFAGSALKFASKSRWATAVTYALLVLLGTITFLEMRPPVRDVNGRTTPPTASIPAAEAPQ